MDAPHVFRRGLILLACALCVSACAVQGRLRQEAVPVPPSGAALRAVLQNGDWLVKRGVHGSDNFVASVTNMPLSHAAIYDADRDEVIESSGLEGVHASPLDEFLSESRRVLVIQPMWATPQNRGAAVAEARRHIGKGYNFSGLVGLPLQDRYYCTQLVIAAYESFMRGKPENPIPPVIKPGQMYHWGRIVYDSGP